MSTSAGSPTPATAVTVEAYNLANVRLHTIRGDLRDNEIELNVAIVSLKHSQKELARRLVTAYTSSEQNSTLAVLLGATSLNDLVTRIETINATSTQDTW